MIYFKENLFLLFSEHFCTLRQFKLMRLFLTNRTIGLVDLNNEEQLRLIVSVGISDSSNPQFVYYFDILGKNLDLVLQELKEYFKVI